MRLYLQNRITRLKTVRAMLENYRAEWQNEPAIVKAVDQLDIEIAFLEYAFGLTRVGTRHITTGKNQDITTLVEDLTWLTAILYSYADDNGRAELKSLMDVSPSDYRNLSAQNFSSAFKTVVEKANDLGVVALGEYGVDAGKLGEFTDTAANLDNLLGISALTSAELKALRKQIRQRLGKARGILKRKVRNLLVPFKSRNQGFWLAFEASMVIIDRRGRTGGEPTGDVTTGDDLK